MRTGLTDTSPEAELVLRQVYRRMPFAKKWLQMGTLYQTARALHAAGLRARQAGATPEEIQKDWRLASLGQALVREIEERPMRESNDNLAVLREVLTTLSRQGIPCALGGSWASSILGKMRFTHDADITVEPFPGKEAAFCASFGDEYYVSLSAVQQAVQQRASFNIIHTPNGFKVDIFVRKDRPFEEAVMQRRQVHALAGDPELAVPLVSPEDIILLKLEWYRLGRETSERQWADVLGVLEIQAEKLDQSYLDTWAATLGVADLLHRARQETRD